MTQNTTQDPTDDTTQETTHDTSGDLAVLHTAVATAKGRAVTSDDGVLDLTLAVAGEDAAGATTPEHLMAAALAGCLQQAVGVAASSIQEAVGEPSVEATVTLRTSDGGGYDASFDLVVEGLEGDHADDVLTRAVALCPFTGALDGPGLSVTRA